MNRPSRTDDTTDHPAWNQNPPTLAADLTTREDMNGVANSREYRSGKGNGLDGELGLGIMDNPPLRGTKIPPRDGLQGTRSLGQRSSGSCPHSKETVALEPAIFPVAAATTLSPPLGRRSKAVLSWAAWIMSVIAMSALLNHPSTPAILFRWSDARVTPDPSGIPQDQALSPISSSPATLATGVYAPSLSKRSTCGTGNPISEADYDTPFHVGALVIILTLSTAACAFSMVMKKVPRISIPQNVFFAIRHFGTGVLIATAFVHLLPTAFISLGDPCLSGFWTEDYPAMPGAIALAGIFFVAIIEMVFSPHRHLHQVTQNRTVSQAETIQATDSAIPDLDSEMEITPALPRQGGSVRDLGPLRGRSLSISRQLSRVGGHGAQVGTDKGTPQQSGLEKSKVDDVESSPEGKVMLTPEQQHNKEILQCMLLEMGILFHSVFIGMALSVSTGKEFIVLLIAISFHQSFEGLALGARIAAIDWPERTWQPWLMAFAYGCTTPIGQAIGLGLHTLYDPAGETGLVLVGTMNAISSGLLVFASLVELLSEDFLSDESWKVLRGTKRVMACLLVLAGAFGMSIVGAWA